MAAYDDDINDVQEIKEDRWTNRSKYERRNQQKTNNPTMMTKYEAKQRIQHLEKKNNELVDGCIQTVTQTQEIAADNLEQLAHQRNQLINIDKNLYEINGNLDGTDVILKGMKSWKGFFKKKFTKEKYPTHIEQQYEPSIPKKSVFKRNKKKRFQNKINENNKQQIHVSENEIDNTYNEKLDELHKGIKILNEMANDTLVELDEHNKIIDDVAQKMDDSIPRMQQQSHIMQKICR